MHSHCNRGPAAIFPCRGQLFASRSLSFSSSSAFSKGQKMGLGRAGPPSCCCRSHTGPGMCQGSAPPPHLRWWRCHGGTFWRALCGWGPRPPFWAVSGERSGFVVGCAVFPLFLSCVVITRLWERHLVFLLARVPHSSCLPSPLLGWRRAAQLQLCQQELSRCILLTWPNPAPSL